MKVALYVMAGVALLLLWAFLSRAAEPGGPSAAKAGIQWETIDPKSLFVEVDQDTKENLLDAWRWKVGDDARVFRATIFGDLFTQTPGGQIYWLNTGSAKYVEVAKNAEAWDGAIKSQGQTWFHWTTLQNLLAYKVRLKEGQVYSWRKEPMLGGAESVDNVDFVPLRAHVIHAGQVAEAIKDKPPGAKIEISDVLPKSPDDGTIFEVVINEELQYSIWPKGRPIPAGWKSVGKSGTKQECLDYIKEVWTDMRPLSLRKPPAG